MTLVEEVARRGFAHVRRGDFRQLAAQLGIVIAEEEISLRPEADACIAKPEPVPLHTDHPEVGFVGWLCERQDDTDGSILLLDSRTILASLDDAVRTTMRQTELIWAARYSGLPARLWPALRETAHGDVVVHPPSFGRPADRTVDGFSIALVSSEPLSIRLEPGEALFVDNRRILHGRGAIAPNSCRRLRRAWVLDPREVAAENETRAHWF